MSKGSKGGGVTTVKQEPAGFIAPMYGEAAEGAQDLFNNYRPEFFPGSTYVPFSPESELAMAAQTNRAINGNPLVNATQAEAMKNIQGGYLNGNEFLRPQLDAEYARIGGNVNSQFATRGAYGSSANQEVLAREQMKAANDILGRNYDSERNRQFQAMGAAPQLAQQDYYDIGALREVGQSREDLFGRQLQEQMDQFQFDQNQDPAALDEYIRRITGLGGQFTSQTTTQPTVKTSPLSSIMRLGQIGMGLFGPSMGLTGGYDPFSGITWNSGRI